MKYGICTVFHNYNALKRFQYHKLPYFSKNGAFSFPTKNGPPRLQRIMDSYEAGNLFYASNNEEK